MEKKANKVRMVFTSLLEVAENFMVNASTSVLLSV